MPISQQLWGAVAGLEAHLFVISNAAGAQLVVSDFGATAVRMEMPAPSGEIADVILGFDRVEDYVKTVTYFGATVGRFGNRIRRGHFVLDGQSFQATINEGPNSLHGGVNGYDKRMWSAAPDETANAVAFTLVSPDGDEGFPGEVRLTAAYTLTEDNCVRVEMEAFTDRPTLCNPVHHSYFNLAGHASGSILDQELQISADFYTPPDDELVITGEVLKVAGTPFDFREARPIRTEIEAVPNAGAGRLDGGFGGYDHNFCLAGEAGRLRPVLSVRDPASGRGFELHTNQLGVHFYTGGYLDESIIGKGEKPYCKFAGFTLETQSFPDSPNLSHVPQARLDPGETYRHVMEFRFFS